MAVGSSTVAPSGYSTDINSIYCSNISGDNFKDVNNSSEIPLLNKSDSLLQRQHINTSGYDSKFLLDSVSNYEGMSKSQSTSNDSVKLFQTGADDVTGDNKATVHTPWTELMKNDTFAFIMWNVTKKHAGFERTDESVEKCLDEFRDKKEILAAYFVSATVRENGYFLRSFINRISKYSYLHDLWAVKKFYDQFKDILEDHRLYHAALEEVLQNMNHEVKFMIYCAQKRFCSCFSKLDVLRYEEQLSSLKQYNFLLKSYLIFGYYIDPIFRSLLTVTGLILNCTILTIFAKHKFIINTSDFMVMNISVNAILILIVHVPLQYINMYYSSILPHGESSYNSLFVVIQTALISVSALSLLTLKAQHHIKAAISSYQLSTAWQNVFCGLAVWLVSFSVAAFAYTLNVYPNNGHVFVSFLYLLLYVLILPVAMNMFTSYVQNVPDNPGKEKLIPSSVITELTKAFWITHVPLFLWLLFEALCGFAFRLVSINYSYVEITFFYVYFSHTCVNALALYTGSSVFSRLMYGCLFPCLYGPSTQQNVMMKDYAIPTLRHRPHLDLM
jgi:hypothetical protein